MILSFKYRIYPNKKQAEVIDNILNSCRFLYNNALEERIAYYKRYEKTLSYSLQAAELKELNAAFPEFEKIYAQSKQQVLKQLDKAFQSFFRRLKISKQRAGFPRFKGKERFNSICFPQVKPDLSGGGIKLLPNKKLSVFGIPNELKVFWHRPFRGRCKQGRIVREADKYYFVLTCDNIEKELLEKTGRSVGLDLGISSFITTDDGIQFHHPKPLKRAKDKLIRKQQELSRKKRGSNNRLHAKRSLLRAHQKVVNIRKDFLHKLSLLLVRRYDIVVLEKLNIASMMKQTGFTVNKENIADASWGVFIELLSYKAEKADKQVVLVNPKNTSKTCSHCGNIKQEISLSERTYHCQACGSAMDRDMNAALNIKRLGTSPENHKKISEVLNKDGS